MRPRTIKLFATDLDGTLLGEASSLRLFGQRWAAIPAATRPLLCYNTGRLLDDTRTTVDRENLPKPDFIIAGVGTAIYDHSQGKILKEFSEILEEGWSRDDVEAIMRQIQLPLTRQPERLQNRFKSSWFLENADARQIAAIKRRLARAGLDVLLVYSSSLHLDILPRWANKGNALQWLIRHLQVKPEHVLVAGDTGNDLAMFQIERIQGIIVGNAQPELYHATKHRPFFHAAGEFAWGVLEGFAHFGLITEDLLTVEPSTSAAMEPLTLPREIRSVVSRGLTKTQRTLIRQAWRKAVAALRKNITPLGFSACSLQDNDPTGIDVNYRSVWARDGSIAICGSMPLVGEEDVRKCQMITLETLLGNLSPNGQIPTNVRIDSGEPDYSGIGGICSIDSGLWTIIAAYEYVQTTRDLNFLRRHAWALQRAMDWLSAHDGNNDALLEIPEAGDWTDLFGRSYNVLYDEVLWYRANICFGRLLEMQGEEQRAGDYLRWSQVIKKEILVNFWPSTDKPADRTLNFADQQYTLGDARYLIAQITPFDFSWRCDVYANILAVLFNVLDLEKARLAFRFMWGVGVNDPYPVANLYPVVAGGDPDWRRYYTVNLMNLPHHYHNGGIWPFIGAQWVRFVHRIGLAELAHQELVKLAELNRTGINGEWEFNEWAHGQTGRPMGKSFQAWSAAEFIRTCHELKLVD
jgi:sucrose-6F-phosphate phosphohydrolase